MKPALPVPPALGTGGPCLPPCRAGGPGPCRGGGLPHHEPPCKGQKLSPRPAEAEVNVPWKFWFPRCPWRQDNQLQIKEAKLNTCSGLHFLSKLRPHRATCDSLAGRRFGPGRADLSCRRATGRLAFKDQKMLTKHSQRRWCPAVPLFQGKGDFVEGSRTWCP